MYMYMYMYSTWCMYSIHAMADRERQDGEGRLKNGVEGGREGGGESWQFGDRLANMSSLSCLLWDRHLAQQLQPAKLPL